MATRKTSVHDLPPDPEGEPTTAMIPLSEAEIDKAILASAGAGIAREIAEQILAGATVDEILGTVDPTESLVGVVFKLRSFEWRRSSFGNGMAFVVMKCQDVDGRERTVTTGSANVMSALRAFQNAKLTDIPALTVKETISSNGRVVYKLARAA